MSPNEMIGERIQLRRNHLNRRFPKEYTQEAVSEKLQELGVAIEPASYSHYEVGRVRITAELLQALSKILTLPIAYFYGEETKHDEFTEEVVLESIQMVAALDGKSDEVSQAAKDHVLRTFRTIRSTVG